MIVILIILALVVLIQSVMLISRGWVISELKRENGFLTGKPADKETEQTKE